MLKRTKCGIPLPVVGNIAMPRHVLNAIAKGNVLHKVKCALDFVHSLLAPQTFRIDDGERRAAIAIEVKIACSRRMYRMQREMISREPRTQLARVVNASVIEMPARAK